MFARNSRRKPLTLHSFVTPLVLAVCVIRGCGPPDDFTRFRNLPPEQQKAEFKALPIDKQIDYYILDQAHEPPRMDLGEDITRQGKSVLPDLLRRLRAEEEDYRRRDIISLIALMHKKYEPLNENREVIDTVENAVEQMQDPVWRRMSQRSLEIIENHPDAPVRRPTPFPDPRTLRP
jgi:hypothetical protein